MRFNETNKVNTDHLKRDAYLYVRQSTFQQVFGNPESTRRQYDLKGRATALGWPAEQIVVIDSDLGQSGVSASDREGFQRLVGEVGTGRAGIVMGLEVSRLARNSSDWHRLLEICALSGTLILDEDGIYDPAHFNDRLLLGLKGTMSEAELHILRARLHGGYMAKARRGELRIRLPVGFVYDAAGKVQLDPDSQVRDAVRLLFTTFARTGSAGDTFRAFNQQGLQFPCRPPHGPRMGELVWNDLSYSRTLDVLHNPRYAGAFVYGRTHQRKLGTGGRTTQRLKREEWSVLLHDMHDGYISWDEFEENQRRLIDNNYRIRGTGGTTPPREGTALLQGIALCGVCGKRMLVHYHLRKGKRVPWYCCQQGPMRWPGDRCQDIPGAGIDESISKLVVEAVTPMALEVALSVQEELASRLAEADRLRREQVERARYDAEAARRRYMRVDPDNRLVADTLEADWNDKLRAFSKAKEDYDRKCQSDKEMLGTNQRDHIEALAADFPTVWNASTTTDKDRKRMLRLIIEDVTLVKHPEDIAAHVRFRGGATKTLSLVRPVPSWKTWLTPSQTVSEIDKLLEQHTDSEIATILNQQGYRSGKGLRFHSNIVSQIRRDYGLKNKYERLRERGMITVDEVAQKAGVTRQTVRRWQKDGQLQAYPCNNKGLYLYNPTKIPTRNQRPKRTKKPVGDSNDHHRSKEVQFEV
jgi:DNA invertase Pin-like site-specific DNA recombinase